MVAGGGGGGRRRWGSAGVGLCGGGKWNCGRRRSNHGIKNDNEEFEKQTVASVHSCFYVTFSCDKLWVGELSGYEVKAVEEDVMVAKPNGKISGSSSAVNPPVNSPGWMLLAVCATSYKVTSQVTLSGFKEVREEEKSQMVGNVFSSVASNYDLMNDVMSGGLHRLWKDRLVFKLNPFPGMRHLDVAGGTGDVAFRILQSLNSVSRRAVQDVLQDNLQEETHIYVCDINPNMLNVGKKRAQERGLEDRSLRWVEGDAEALCFEDASMDGYTIAFGIRNVTHIEKVLAEAYRVRDNMTRVMPQEVMILCSNLPSCVQLYEDKIAPVVTISSYIAIHDHHIVEHAADHVCPFYSMRSMFHDPADGFQFKKVLKPGGRFLCLELSHVEAPGFKQLYDYYSFSVIPALGELVAGDRESYQYLVESIRRFPPQDMFASMIADAGFQKVEYENLVGGVVAIHSGLKF
ncbi:hypothetical protein RHGRI_014250 [Rhododendron griersonianum]|uniref:2-methoxy-6-polyprenyl-1,4-benzoquinol methylase, mitochondrial n=1 Tax=Rhododendron griersonianum TaxID=479676 RepID=A0AAV6K8Y2_9ERIC|nr:hypothetical protein RHGRI_014250 [Rhododendron griersonianum]